jgi:glycosyltransferase involved in cell wall biosynthesis
MASLNAPKDAKKAYDKGASAMSEQKWAAAQKDFEKAHELVLPLVKQKPKAIDVQVEAAQVDGEPVFGCFGHLNETKRLPQLFGAFIRLRRDVPGARLLLVGPSPARLRDLELPEGVLREDYVSEPRLWALMAAADVHVALRAPTMGETSGSVIRSLSLGKPLVVSDVGWFSELPDDVALAIPPDGDEVATLTAALELLATRTDVREAMGARAAELARREHAVDRSAELYVAALERSRGGASVDDAVLHEVSTAAADVGISADSAEASEIARRLAEVELG